MIRSHEIDWYQDSYDCIATTYADDPALMCALLALTSANTQVIGNATLAKKAYNQIKSHGTITRSGYIKAHYVGIIRYLETGKITSRKCASYHECLTNPDSQRLPVDIWMLRAYGFTHDQPTKLQYDAIEADVLTRARAMGVSPRTLQARIWLQARGKADSYANYFRQRRLL